MARTFGQVLTQHEKEMERGSRLLRDAILAARKGTNPGTPSRPFRLPREQ